MSNQLHKSWFGKMQKEEESSENGNDNDKEDEDEGDMSNQIAKQLVRENAEKERKQQQQQQLGAEKGKIASAKVRRLTSWHWKSKKLRQEIQKKIVEKSNQKNEESSSCGAEKGKIASAKVKQRPDKLALDQLF